MMYRLHIILTFSLLASFLFSFHTVASQNIKGKIIDSETERILPFVHIGVKGKNKGTISDDKGYFKILIDNSKSDVMLSFSMIGYEEQSINISSLFEKFNVIELRPKTYQINEVIIAGKQKIESAKLGRFRTSKSTTGQSGTEIFGFGGEWGLKIEYPGNDYFIKNINFHTRFNTMDSVLFRLNVYNLEDNIPSSSKLQKPLFVKSYAKDKWISRNVTNEQILVTNDLAVTFELIQIWYKENGSNNLFYTHGKGYEQGTTFSRNSSFDNWSIDERGPIAMYIDVIVD